MTSAVPVARLKARTSSMGFSFEEVAEFGSWHRAYSDTVEGMSFDGINIQSFLDLHDSPALLFSRSRLLDNIDSLRKAWRSAGIQARLFFAVKCCYLTDVLATVSAESDCGLEVMSYIELQLALSAGCSASTIIAGGTAKSERYMREAIVAGVRLIVVDSLREALALDRLCRVLERSVTLAVRIAPELSTVSNCFIPADGKLGLEVDGEELKQVLTLLASSTFCRIDAVHVHAMTHCSSPESYRAMVAQVVDDMNWLRQNYDFAPRILDLGGGIETRYLLSRNGVQLQDFTHEAAKELSRLSTQVEVYIEPGRYIAADAAIVATRVIDVKRKKSRNWVIVDVSSNVLIPLPDVGYHPVPTELDAGALDVYDVSDATCVPNLICSNCELPAGLDVGSILVLNNVGAYTTVYAEAWSFKLPQFFFIESPGIARSIFSFDDQQTMYRLLYRSEVQL